ncbi:MAG: ABC transporter ATP-binding protein [Proteobacteria bacterium]|nr:ABC transporter ATP-binding protein [Pseudomonadota bacterium]MBI3498475.1 ABC transporter ATP-binding protein [Pseudomonadota bacterium]
MIEIEGLTKRFGSILAVDHISFAVDHGEVLGFLGPNGAGKSTTMKMITGFLAPSSGSARVCGFDVADRPIEVKKRVGYLPEGAPGYPDMTPAAFLDFIARIRSYSGAEKRRRVAEAVAKTQLDEVLYQPIDTLSKGFKRRVGLAQALLHDPEVLILDEPTDGLDPNQKHEVRTLIRAMAADKAIIISTHILEEVDAVCTRAVVIAQGRIVADGTPAELEQRSRYHNAVTIRLVNGADLGPIRAALQRLSSVAAVDADGTTNTLTAFASNRDRIVEEVGQISRENEWPIAEIRVERGRLDEVFRRVTQP